MSMTRNLGVALAFTVVVAVGALGYIAGSNLGRGPAATNVDVNALVREAMASRIKATPIGGTDFQAVELSDDQRIEVQDIIKNYLIANPEIVRDAMNALQIREDATAKAAQTMAIADNSDLIFDSNREVVLGNPKGKTTLVEFFDYNCAYCRAAHQDMLDLMAKDPDVRVVLKEFPVLGDGSVQAAQVGVAVHLVAPDKYFAFHDALIREKGQVDGERALAIAGEVGVDPEVIRAKLADSEIQNTINESYDLAGKLALTGTPSYVTRKEVVVGAVGYMALRARLDAARDCAQTATC